MAHCGVVGNLPIETENRRKTENIFLDKEHGEVQDIDPCPHRSVIHISGHTETKNKRSSHKPRSWCLGEPPAILIVHLKFMQTLAIFQHILRQETK